MAVLTSTGIIFGDSTVIDSKYGMFPQGTPVIFYQVSAPTGWSTPGTQYPDRALRIISGGTLTAGGVNGFVSTFSSKPISANLGVSIFGLSVNPSTIDVNTMVQHAHPANSGGNQANGSPSPSLGSVGKVAPGSSTGNYGNSGSHTHPVSFSSANGPINTSVDFRVLYIDVICCTFA